MAKAYVKFETPKELAGKIAETLQLAKESGTVRKGANEVTKSVERGLASFVVLAEDVEPEEVVMHIPTICGQKKVPFGYIATKLELGRAIGMNVPCAAAAIEKPGGSEHLMKDVIARITGKTGGGEKAPQEKEQAQKQKPAQPKQKKEAPKDAQAPGQPAKPVEKA